MTTAPSTSGIDVLYSDTRLVLVNKPSGLLSVPGRGPDKRDCVLARVQQSFPTARVVHRLDCATSGLMVLALDADSHRELSRQFHDRETSKRYVAVVQGCPSPLVGEIEHPLLTDWPNRPKQMIDYERGKQALTRYQVLESFEQNGMRVSRVSLTPVTGRTHQLRVHMLSLGTPILGDGLYAEGDALQASSRLLLHARYLSFKHPESGERQEHELAETF